MKNDKMGPVQGFAFGGIANPTQRATLRPSDRAYLEARQRELDAYERQRLAYNKALEDYQSREQTEEFRMAAPVLPFKEAEVAARQQQAAQAARKDAANRAAAISVVSDPERFGFGSLSIADRFMAKGGEVRGYAEGGEATEDEDEEGVGEVGSAKALLAQLEGQEPASEKKKTQSASLKRMAMSGGAAMPKPMDMSPESLASTRELVAMAKDKGTAKEQMAELARLYQLRAATFSQPTLTGRTMGKDTLTAKRFAGGGEAQKPEGDRAPEVTGINRVLDFIAQRLPAESFPTSARTLLETVQGKKEPITESSFSPKELDMMRQIITLKGGDKGSVQYSDYAKAAKQMARQGNLPTSVTPGLLSMTDPLGNVQTTLGRFRYARDPEGNMVVMDTYDFNPPVDGPTQEARTGDYGAFGPYGLIRDYAGQKIPTGSGRAIRINLGKPVSRAKGSPEEGEMTDPEAALFEGRRDVPAPARNKVLDEILGAGETALTLGTGAAASLAGMPYGLYKGLTSGKYLEGKAADIAGKEAAAFMERNTYRPRTESAQENLATLAKVADKMKLAPAPGGAAIASIPRTAALAQAERLGMAAEKKLEGPVTRTLERGGKAADLLGSFGTQPSYAVRPTGSTMLTGPVGFKNKVGEVDKIIDRGVYDAGALAGRDNDKKALLENFWNKKARNYFERQFGTPDDPVLEGIKSGKIKGTSLSSDLRTGFPDYLMSALEPGKTRIKEGGRADPEFMGPGSPETRFFPKFPEAYEDVTRRYDEGTGLQSSVTLMDPAAADPQYTMLSSAGREMVNKAVETETDRMLGQGLRPELINPKIGGTARSIVSPERVINTGGTSAAQELFKAYEEAAAFAKMTPKQRREFVRAQGVEDVGDEGLGQGFMAENVRTAIEKGEPVYDIGYMSKPVRSLFNTEQINQYLSGLPAREVANIRFEDAVRGGVKVGENKFRFENLINRIKEGKPVEDKVFSDGVGKPLLQIKEGPLEGFAWKRIEKREATVPEGAYVGHSVGGYEMGGPTYTSDKREGFNTGKWQVYTLRDNRNRPVNTIEVRMDDENSPVVTQIKGNGRATGNAAPEKYGAAVVEFLEGYLKPVRIEEDSRFLTPQLQTYKQRLSTMTAEEKERALYRELGLE